MAVEYHPPHALTKRTESSPYGCKDRVFADGYYAPARVFNPDGSFEMGSKFIRHTLSTECRYSESLTDPRCGTCKHRDGAPKYDEMIRRVGT